MAAKRKRAGRTRTFSVSVDASTKAQLQAAAERLHKGNMSRLFTAVAQRLTEDAAFEHAWNWYGGAVATADENAVIDEWIESVIGKPKRRKTRAA